jgi:hypothetical protein
MARRVKTNNPLIEIANKIRKFERSTISNAVETGRLLHEASEICEHGEYQAWIDREFGWSYRTAVNYRNAFEFAEMCNSFTFDGISDVDELNLSLSALYLVAAMKKLPATDTCQASNEVRAAADAIIEAAKVGRVTYSMARAIASEVELRQAIEQREAASEPTEPEVDSLEQDDAASDDVDDDASDDVDDAAADDEASPSYGMTEVDHATLKLAHLQAMLETPQDERFWSSFVNHVGAAKLREFIAKLQAVYDEHCESSAVKSATDRAEDKTKARLN